jgi:RNA polymerase sigma factor (sigma-70 family)
VSKIQEEKLLLYGLANNSKVAIEEIYKSNHPLILKLILKNGGTVDDADDVFQEAMVVLYKKSLDAAFELNCQIGTYLYAVSRKLWLKRLHEHRRFGVVTSDFDESIFTDTDVEDHEQKQADFNSMDRALDMIGEPCKSLIQAFYIEKKPMQLIAEQFNYTNADNAKTQKYKCLMRLKKIFFAQKKDLNDGKY